MSFRHYEPSQVGGMLIYEGSRRQRGGNLMNTLKRAVLPLGRSLMRRGRKIGVDLAKRGVKVGVGAVRDRIRKGPSITMKEALKRRATTAADKAVVDYLGGENMPDIPFLSQDGMGLKRRKRKRKTIRKTINKRRIKKRKAINKKRKTKSKKKKKRRKASDIFS